jgi:hypothetical protein
VLASWSRAVLPIGAATVVAEPDRGTVDCDIARSGHQVTRR